MFQNHANRQTDLIGFRKNIVSFQHMIIYLKNLIILKSKLNGL